MFTNSRIVAGAALAAALLVLPASANATEDFRSSGWYLGFGAMPSFQTDSDADLDASDDTVEYNIGWGITGSVGYAWRNGFRAEGEMAYRRSSVSNVNDWAPAGYPEDGDLSNFSLMGNVLYDIDTGTIFTPYVGVGIGASVVNADNIGQFYPSARDIDDSSTEFAYQGIAGVSAKLNRNWALTADYRYFATTDASLDSSAGNDSVDLENASHNVVVGVRYTFNQPMAPIAQSAPVPVVVNAPVAVERPSMQQAYMVFFDFNKAVLTPEAKRIIGTAASEFKSGRNVRLSISGHTDTVGSANYNKKLSVRRAEAVKSEFIAQGVSANEISTIGTGKNDLLIPTADGVREAQNRRAEIVFGGQ